MSAVIEFLEGRGRSVGVRDEMQAALSERFLPKYERLIEDYYKRLAEERSAGP